MRVDMRCPSHPVIGLIGRGDRAEGNQLAPGRLAGGEVVENSIRATRAGTDGSASSGAVGRRGVEEGDIHGEFPGRLIANPEAGKELSINRWHDASSSWGQFLVGIEENSHSRRPGDAVFQRRASRMRPFVGGVGVILTLHHVRPRRADAFQPNRLLEVTPDSSRGCSRYLRRSRLDSSRSTRCTGD